jgi:hypothetical protein
VHHPDARRWFRDDRILPGLSRVEGGSSESSDHLSLVALDTVPASLALLDAPDIDSVVDANRAVAAQLLDAADLWLFVTTAARYGDAVPWEFLRRAVARGVAVGVVLNRVPPGAGAEIGPHLDEMLRAEGLGLGTDVHRRGAAVGRWTAAHPCACSRSRAGSSRSPPISRSAPS